MLKTEKLEGFSSVNIKECRSSSVKTRWRPRQKGSILIGIIITMVVMATLGGAMVYLTTTSTFQELFANNHARAYYAAESGGGYANALIRQSLATGNPTKFDVLQATYFGTNASPYTYTMANGDSFQITNWIVPPGALSKNVTFDSIGTVGSGFLQAKRKITYRIYPADQGGLMSLIPPPIPQAFSDFEKPAGSASDASWLGTVFSPTTNQDTKVFENPKVDNDYALNLAAATYTMGLKWYANSSLAQLDAIRLGNGGLLSYGVQVKIKDIDVDYPSASPYSITGISFRLDDRNNADLTDDLDNMYGISFVKLIKPTENNVLNQTPAWYKNYIHSDTGNAWDTFSTGTNAGTWFVVLWKRIFTGSSPTYSPIAYQKISTTGSVCRGSTANGCTKIDYWSTIMVYVYETSTGNEVRCYLSSPLSPLSYLRSTIEAPQTTLWAEKDGVPNTNKVPNPFQPISWTVVGELWKVNTGYIAGNRVNVDSDGDAYICNVGHTSAADTKPGTGANWTTRWSKLSGSSFIQDSSLTTANYTGYTIDDFTGTKAREIGLHIFNISTSAQNIYYDNFYIDLTPSGHGYLDASGQVIVGP